MFKIINGGRLPERATKYSTGFDVFANETVVIGTGETKLVPLGIAIDETCSMVNSGDMFYHYFELHPRSSLRLKGVGGGVGIIDMDYINLEIKMILTAPYGKLFSVKRGDKIGQLILQKHWGFLLPSEYKAQVERSGGFGSTGE